MHTRYELGCIIQIESFDLKCKLPRALQRRCHEFLPNHAYLRNPLGLLKQCGHLRQCHIRQHSSIPCFVLSRRHMNTHNAITSSVSGVATPGKRPYSAPPRLDTCRTKGSCSCWQSLQAILVLSRASAHVPGSPPGHGAELRMQRNARVLPSHAKPCCSIQFPCPHKSFQHCRTHNYPSTTGNLLQLQDCFLVFPGC